MNDRSAPLVGLTVLDFTHALAGPYCSMLLAAYGARVIKIESPEGDMGRAWGPPFHGEDSAYFAGLNSGKQSVVLDLKTEGGLAHCRQLAARSDILLENFRPGAMTRLGLDYATLSASNPRLIYASISGYGQTGPRRMEPAMDTIIQAASGLMSITGTPGGETVKTGHSICDITAGMFALIGVLLAVEARHRSGHGQFVDVSMMDTVISTMLPNFARFLVTGVLPRPLGTQFEAIVPYRNFHCSDREITVAAASEKLWRCLCEALGLAALTDDPRFRTNPLRVRNRAQLEPQLEAAFLAHPAQHWLGALAARGVPCTLVRNLGEVIDDPQTTARDMLVPLPHAAGNLRVLGVPVKLSDTPGVIRSPAPLLGADTDAVLAELRQR